jgi:hypothetical protein
MIQTRYFCQINHDFYCDLGEEEQAKIEDEIFLNHLNDVEDLELFQGSGASYPYISFWSDCRETAEKEEQRILAILKSHHIKINSH